MALNKYKLGGLIEQRREKFAGTEDLPSRGVSREGFIMPKQEDADTSIYNVFYYKDFVFNPARMELNSIALNLEFEKAICSSLYEVFYVTREDIVLPEYLNLFIKRDEFARKCWFEAIGSARNYFRVTNLNEFDIDLPPIDIQKKYVAIYNSLLENQKSYERGLEDLKLVCDAYIEDLRRKYPSKRIGEFIEIVDNRNNALKYGITEVKGISTGKEFIETKANMDGVGLTSYKIVNHNEFAYVPDTSRRGEKIAIAYNSFDTSILVSSIYTVFRVCESDKLNFKYLFLFFNRSEFDRYSRFNSWGSARETFDWNDMQDVCIPIPDINIQKSIAEIADAYSHRISINEKLKQQIKDICPILIKGSIEDGRKF